MAKILLINDTRLVGHHGSTAVVDVIHTQFAERGIHVVSDLAEPLDLATVAETYAAVVINGEGAMHDGARNSRAFSKLAVDLKAEGVPAFLINTVYQETLPAIVQRMSSFTGIYCREALSVDLLARQGVHADSCPDLTFALQPPEGLKWRPENRIVVLDSTVKATNRALFAFANAHGLRFQTMRYAPAHTPTRSPKHFRRRLRFGLMQRLGRLFPGRYDVGRYANATSDRDAFFLQLTEDTRVIVTGRFHGICVCMKLGVPFLAIASNTHKVEGLLADAGLSDRLLKPGEERDLAQIEARAEWTPEDEEKRLAYLQEAQSRIAAMFDAIAETARTSAQSRGLPGDGSNPVTHAA